MCEENQVLKKVDPRRVCARAWLTRDTDSKSAGQEIQNGIENLTFVISGSTETTGSRACDSDTKRMNPKLFFDDVYKVTVKSEETQMMIMHRDESRKGQILELRKQTDASQSRQLMNNKFSSGKVERAIPLHKT